MMPRRGMCPPARGRPQPCRSPLEPALRGLTAERIAELEAREAWARREPRPLPFWRSLGVLVVIAAALEALGIL